MSIKPYTLDDLRNDPCDDYDRIKATIETVETLKQENASLKKDVEIITLLAEKRYHDITDFMAEVDDLEYQLKEAIEMGLQYSRGEVITLGIARLVDEQCVRAYEARDEAKAEVTRLKKELAVRPWVEGDAILQGEHEADIGQIGVTWRELDAIKKEVAERQREACVARVRWLDNSDPTIGFISVEILDTPLVTDK